MNILVGIHTDEEESFIHEFKIFGDIGYGFREILSRKNMVEPGGNPHYYLTIPSEVFCDDYWGEEIEEIFIAMDERGSHGSMIFIE